ncbi:leucine-rich repeat domain-containing protein [Occultella glacieicola]|uniref:Leucine-rich repeat domain-containing protein n=1 Tax=Occultella glacieicola TaxID=2518684 RepID=A0ABY2E1T2_9MICO|nr:leucine-rich repeat domain-containing protein [Occultella glacieicola]TDE92578.1 leucine-rich repeat domain-containing protein [Occultella glacieicola]
MPLKSVWWVAAGLVAAVAVVLCLVRLASGTPLPLPLVLLIALAGASPVLVAAAAGTTRRPRAPGAAVSALVAAGVLLAGGGLLVASTDGFLALRLATIDWRILARAATATAPLGLVGVGAAWVVAAVGLARRRRAWIRAAAGVLALTSLWFAASLTAASVWRVRAGTPLLVDGGGIAVAVPLAVAGVLALGVPWVAGARDPGRWAEPRPHPHARPVAAGLALILVAGGAVALWVERGERHVLAEVFPDPALAACVADAVGASTPAAQVSDADLTDVLSLECPGPGTGPDTSVAAIVDLTGLDRLRELSSLDLTGNTVTDLTPLTGLDLWGVVITDNPVSDLTPLQGMATLTNLGASGTRVVDLTPLAGQATLAYLGLRGTGISDLRPLASMGNLNEVDLGDNAITDVAPLAEHPYLTSLDLAGNDVADLGPLGPLPQLWTLELSGNRITDLSSVPAFPVLSELWLGENPLTDVTALTTLPALTGVDLAGAPPGLPGIAELRATGVYVGGLA